MKELRHTQSSSAWLSHSESPILCPVGLLPLYHVPNTLLGKGVGEEKKNNASPLEVGTPHCEERIKIHRLSFLDGLRPAVQAAEAQGGSGELFWNVGNEGVT